MISRSITSLIKTRLEYYPAVALLGPRQSGKTTLAKTFPGTYYDLEKEQDRLRVDVEWEPLHTTDRLLIFDEAQEMPDLFPRLRSAIDEDRKRTGRFLLLGSVAPTLMRQVSESLAGRMALCELTPLLAQELGKERKDDLWHFGGYPDGGILNTDQYPTWEQFYLELLAQRDLPHWGLSAQPAMTLRLFRMLAALHGQLWNASQIGKSLGVSYHTINKYVDLLEHAFLIRRLTPFASNIKKRLVKSPKIYWRDSGLLHALLGLSSRDDLLAKPWIGVSWEGWIIEQLLSHLKADGQEHQAYHLRTSDQKEIDLLLEYKGERWAFEIKLTHSPKQSDLKKLESNAKLIGAHRSYVISRTTEPVATPQRGSVNLEMCLDLLFQ